MGGLCGAPATPAQSPTWSWTLSLLSQALVTGLISGRKEQGLTTKKMAQGGREAGGFLLSQVPNGSSLIPIALCLVPLSQMRQSRKVRKVVKQGWRGDGGRWRGGWGSSSGSRHLTRRLPDPPPFTQRARALSTFINC